MSISFYQIAGDEPGTSIYINPFQIVKIVPYGRNTKIHLSDKTTYEIAQVADVVQRNVQRCFTNA